MIAALSLHSCVWNNDAPDVDSKVDNFETLWKWMDEHYCFFDYKKQTLGVDWDEVHARYSRQVSEKMTQEQFFEVMCNMLGELKDGHVNLSASYGYGHNWSFYEDYPRNYNDSIVDVYLGTDYVVTSGLKYTILKDNIGYVRCESFEDGIGEGNVNSMLNKLASCSGLIIDVRNNGGGLLTSANTLASHFTNKRILKGYSCHKTGKGHSDFSSLVAEYLEPSDGICWQKKAVVLTNRACFSATNDFVACMKECENTVIMGDKTGGGSGMPFNADLPNGWLLRYSAVVFLDAHKQQIEFGIEPDVNVQMDGADTSRNKDTLVETARELLKK